MKEAFQGEVQIIGIYLRSVSLETGGSPFSVTEETKPEIKFELRFKPKQEVSKSVFPKKFLASSSFNKLKKATFPSR